MHVYMCRYCGAKVVANTTPIQAGCPVKRTHTWISICTDCNIAPQPGYIPYQCISCGTILYCKRPPTSTSCHKGGSHRWRRMVP